METTPTTPMEPAQMPANPLKLTLKVEEKEVQDHLRTFVRQSVEEALNAALNAEADALCGAKRYERNPDRVDTRAGHYERELQTSSGPVKLKIPKLRKMTFESEIIERYRRRECSVEEAMVEMYLAGVSVRRVEDITEALWGTRVSASTVSEMNQKIYETIDRWRNQPITGKHAYVYLDGIWLKRSWGGEVTNVAVLVAIGVNQDGFREILGVVEGMKEDKESWLRFLRHLKERGLDGVRLFVSDKCLGLVDSIGDVYPQAKWQRCVVHFQRNIMSVVPKTRVREVVDMVKAIHAQEDLAAAQRKADEVVSKLIAQRLKEAAELIRTGISETLSYMDFPREHWKRIRTNNALERMNREIRRRTRVVGNFPDGRSALMLVSARLRYLSTTNWGQKRYMDMALLVTEDSCGSAA
jgi:putative transposase